MRKVEICGIDTSKLVKLTNKESEKLLIKIKEGDREARNMFTLANIRLVLSIIRRFPQSKISSDDMFQAGMIGLIKAVENFDISVGVRFSTYAVPMIIGEIKRVMHAGSFRHFLTKMPPPSRREAHDTCLKRGSPFVCAFCQCIIDFTFKTNLFSRGAAGGFVGISVPPPL